MKRASKVEVPRIRYSLRQAAQAIGISRTAIYEAVAAGRLKAVPLGGDGALGQPGHRGVLHVGARWIAR